MLDRCELTDGRLLGTTSDNASSRYSMTCVLQWTLEATGIGLAALRNHIPCMAHVILLVVSAFMSSFSVKGRTKTWQAYERDQHSGENESIDIRQSQGLRKESNATINKVSAMRPG